MIDGPASLSPKQALSIRDATAPVNIWHGSVSSGKTIASIIAWLLFVANDAPRGGELPMIGRTLDTIYRNVIKPAIEMFPANACPITYTKGASTGVIFGREVVVLGANDARSETRIRGMTAAGAYVDEGSLLPDHAYWMQLINRLRLEGARLFVTTNPDNPTHWLKTDVIDDAEPSGYNVWHFTMEDNPALPPGYIEGVKRANKGLYYRRNVLGEWVLAEGTIYDMFDVDAHVIDEIPEGITDWMVACDYGTAGVFAAVLIGIDKVKQRLIVAREWRWDAKAEQRQLTDVQFVAKLQEWLVSIDPVSNTRESHELTGARTPSYTWIDPSATSFINQMYASHWPGVKLADNPVSDGIRSVSSLLGEHRLLIHRSCTGLLGEIPGYVWDPKKAMVGEDAPVKARDHSLDALRYGVMGTRRWWRHWITDPIAFPEAA